MAEPTVDRDPVEMLAAEFVDRLRAGEGPSIEAYATAHPEWADQIRELFPTIAAMENLKSHKESLSGGRASLGPGRIERLGDFRIVREIGRGGMGIVYEAEQESLGRRVAVKVLPKQALLDDKHLRRFRREAKTAAKLHHTNIVPVLGVGEQDGYHYYVMQIIRGVGLDEIIPRLKLLARLGSGEAQDDPSLVFEHGHWNTNVSDVARALVEGDLRALTTAHANGDSVEATSGRGSSTTGSHSSSPTQSRPELTGSQAEAGLRKSNDQAPLVPAAVAETGTKRFGSCYWQSVARIGLQVAKALQYAHRQGTLHRDIKPANLLIDERGTIWVADFGLAKAVEQDEVTRSGDIVGTLRYMAPEQFQGVSDARSDVYSLGLTLYELLTLRPAYNESDRKRSFVHKVGTPEPPRPRKLNPAIPRDLETIVLKTIQEEPQARYQTAAELAEDLERFLDDRPILARRASAVERLWRWARRNPAVASLSSLAASLLLLVAIVSTTAYFRTEQQRAIAAAQHQRAEATSDLAWGALDRIFDRLAPNRYVSPEDFAAASEESDTGALQIDSQPVLSQETAQLLEEMLTFYDALAAQGDNDNQFRQRIAEAHRRVADIHKQLGQFPEAEQAYRKAIAVYGQLDPETQKLPGTLVEVASIQNELGQVLWRMRKGEDGRAAYEEAQRLLEPLATPEAAPALRYELARNYYLQSARPLGVPGGEGPEFGGRRGGPGRDGRPGPPPPGLGEGRPGPPPALPEDQQARGWDRGRGRAHLDKAVALLTDLTKEYDVPDYQQLLAMCYVEQYKRLRWEEPDRCRESLLRSVAILEDLVARYPRNPDYRFTLSNVYVTELFDLGSRAQADPAQLEKRIRAALSLLQDLHRERPQVPEYLLSQAGIHANWAMLYVRQGDYGAALAEHKRGLEVMRSLERNYSALPPELTKGMLVRDTLFFASAILGRLAIDQRRPSLDGPAESTSPRVPREVLEAIREQLLTTQQGITALLAKSAGSDQPERQRLEHALGMSYWCLEQIHTHLGDQAAAAAAREKLKELRFTDRMPWGGPRGRDDRDEGRGGRGGRGRGDRDGFGPGERSFGPGERPDGGPRREVDATKAGLESN